MTFEEAKKKITDCIEHSKPSIAPRIIYKTIYNEEGIQIEYKGYVVASFFLDELERMKEEFHLVMYMIYKMTDQIDLTIYWFEKALNIRR